MQSRDIQQPTISDWPAEPPGGQPEIIPLFPTGDVRQGGVSCVHLGSWSEPHQHGNQPSRGTAGEEHTREGTPLAAGGRRGVS